MTEYPLLSQPITIQGRTVPNRIVLPPLVMFSAEEDGRVNDFILAHYRAVRGPGLVVVEATAVSPEGRLARRQLGIFEDGHVPGLRELAAVIRANGALPAIQIHHAGRQTTMEKTFGRPLIAPSAIPFGKGETPRAMDDDDIERVLECFCAAAERAAEAGFDAVELHGAHGYLASQFLSPAANHREDQWGGGLENRARFLREALRRVRARVGNRLIVYCRLGVVDDGEGGLSLSDGVAAARLLAADGIPLLHVSNGIGLPKGIAPEGSPYSDRFHLGIAVKKAVATPVIGIGDIIRPEQAEQALAEGVVDLVALGRGLLADPRWAEKALSGRAGEISVCRRCRVCGFYTPPVVCPARKKD